MKSLKKIEKNKNDFNFVKPKKVTIGDKIK